MGLQLLSEIETLKRHNYVGHNYTGSDYMGLQLVSEIETLKRHNY